MTPDIHDYIGRVLLRYFRAGRDANVVHPSHDADNDLDILRWHWAASSQVQELCRHLINNRHEVQSSLGEQTRTDDAMVRGRLEGRLTVIARALSGHPTRVVFAEPVRTYTSGPNHVLVWVLQQANRLLHRFAEAAGPSSGYAARAAEAIRTVSEARRINSIARAIADTKANQRPAPQSLTQAAASRKRLYRLAFAACDLLRRIEQGNPEAISGLLRDTLIAPLHEWQAFELSMALAMAEAVSAATGMPLQLRVIAPGGSSALMTVGDYVLHWQSKTTAFSPPVPEFSEVLVNRILMAYGLDPGVDRPDIVLLHRKRVMAIGEAKFFTDETDGWRSAFRDAAAQLVRYARGYAVGGELEALISRSLIALWSFPEENRPAILPPTTPIACAFEDFRSGNLSEWAVRVVNGPVIHSAA